MKNNLARLLSQKKVAAKKVSDATLIDVSSLSKMKNHERSISQENAIVLADYFDISIDELFDREYTDISIIEKKKNITYEDVILRLSDLSNKELLSLSGAIDFLLMSRNEDKTYYKTIEESNKRYK